MRLSVTTLEAYRLYLNGIVSQEDLIKQITGVFEPSKYMEYGKKFHEILEKPNTDHKINDLEFDKNDMIKCREFILPAALNEVKSTKMYGDTELVGKVDQIFGNLILEHKTTFSYINLQKYMDSLQWKCYLDIFGADRVIYNIFHFNNKLELKNIETFEVGRYAGLEKYIRTMISSYNEFYKKIYSKR